MVNRRQPAFVARMTRLPRNGRDVTVPGDLNRRVLDDVDRGQHLVKSW
jgi:hypothetical protein